ncbi:ATP-binding cassette, subfamily B [Arthrobacter sp. ok909]|uniref:ABC transporter ATP-binding protein n=1 Tax=Arthrobacter sp. ok909 TaxID=1761746 RepID=UPI00088FC678|nr:ABC transporter ATP-binding protein [Arthrobacter sp. ok909]SDP80238.1 ATP-binding cassette, subfamily B [Arthrobacter sp. ok909]
MARANNGYILELGAVMMAIALLQIECAVFAVYFAAKTAMGVWFAGSAALVRERRSAAG